MGHVESVLLVMPWAPHVMAVFVFLAVMFGSRLSATLGMSEGWVATLLIGLGLIVALTLTPISDPLGPVAGTGAWLALPHVPLLPSRWWPLDERALNVLVYVPLGLAVAHIRSSRWLAGVLVAGGALPFLVESAQRLVLVMHRSPEWIDVADNLIGLSVGLAIGFAIRGLALVGSHESSTR